MTIQILPFANLSTADFHDMIAIRIGVFVVEQDCAYMELDGKDKDAFHLIVKDDDGTLIATLRILKPGVAYPEVSIGRVASHASHRHKKLGHQMMTAAMEFIRTTMNNPDIRISAQTHLCRFYAAYGFEKTGKEYLDDNILHSEMLFRSHKS
ncbi:MAG: GNAT family N-acetyltransferase [Bacteroidetes bacterium]|nr:GNAT family N-acetyltransferase [Bacteroidota bacterium]